MPAKKEQAVEAVEEQPWSANPTYDEVVAVLQNDIANLTMELSVTKLSLGKALARVQELSPEPEAEEA